MVHVCSKPKPKTFLCQVCILLTAFILLYILATSYYGIQGNTNPILRSSDWIQSEKHFPGQRNEEYFKRVLWESNVRLANFTQPIFHDDGHVVIGPPILSGIDSGQGPNVKVVLLWTPFYGIVDWGPKVICEGQEKTCVTTSDKDLLLKSDALLMHPIDLKGLPSERIPGQRWIYFIQEPPQLVGMAGFKIKDHNSVFNWTMTYRREADFPFLFYQAEPMTQPLTPAQYKDTFAKIMGNKKRMVFAAITNCQRDYTKRLEVIEELQKYVHVDFYGKCGNKVCPKDSLECAHVFSEYKFFLAFENSNCRDYITEKVQRALHDYNAIPIVMGGSHPNDYLKIMPPNSFINSQGFATVKELAYFILFLNENVMFYERFHLWRQSHRQKSTDQWCRLCKAVHNSSFLPSQVYTKFDDWYSQDTCRQ